MLKFLKGLFGGNTAEIEAHAETLATLFAKHLTVVQIRNERLTANAERIVLATATGYKRQFGWSGSTIARLSNRFAWKLIDRGYPKEASLLIAKRITVGLMGKGEKPSAGSV